MIKKIKVVLSAFVLFFCTNILFSQTYNQDNDEIDFYVPGILANDAMQQVNFLLCFMKNTNFHSFVDRGIYKALVDESKCENASGLDAASEALQATGGSADTAGGAINETDGIKYTTAVFQTVTSGSEFLGKGWVSLKFQIVDGGSQEDITAYVKVNLREDASSSSRFGSFTMLYDLRNDSAVPAIGLNANTSIEKGYLDVSNNIIKYRSSGFDDPPRSIEVDFSNTNNVQGVLQHVVKINDTDEYSVKHQIHVNESQNLYCQKYLTAHLMTKDQPTFPYWSQGNTSIDAATFQTVVTNANDVQTDGGDQSTITTSQCWDLRKSEAKRIVYEYGTYDVSGTNPNRKDLTTPSISLEARSTTDPNNTGLTNPIWAHASYWGVHVNDFDRAAVNSTIVFKNSRDNSPTSSKYRLVKNYYEIEKRSRSPKSLNSLDKVSFQTNISWFARDNSPFQQKIGNLGFPTSGSCNSNPLNIGIACPEYSGYITVNPNGTQVTFNITHAMSWDSSNRVLPFELPTANKFSFTATQWATQMTNGNGWDVGMWFHDPDAHQGYWVPYTAFSNVSANNVITNTESKISLQDLQTDITNAAGATGLICIRHCLGYDELNSAIDAAFTALNDPNVSSNTPLPVTPYLDIGPYLKSDSYFDNNPNNDQRDAGEPIYNAGRHNFIDGVRTGEVGRYVIASDNNVLKIQEQMIGGLYAQNQTNFIEYMNTGTNNRGLIDSRNHRDGLGNYRYKTKPNTYTEENRDENFGWAFHMDTVLDSTQNTSGLLSLNCNLDAGNNARNYSSDLKAVTGNNSQHFTGATEYYCGYKFNEIATKYHIRLKQMPVYSLVDNATNLPVNITAPETVVLTVPAGVTYNFPNTDLTGKKFKLKFEGFGALHNLPGRVVDICNNIVIGRYTDNWNRCYRFVHEFVIPDGTILKDLNGNDYLKVRALRGDEYLKKVATNYDSFSKGLVNIPTDALLQDIFTDIGSKPAITLPSAGSEEASVVHGVTVITP